MELSKPPTFSCPAPINDYPKVLLAHGGGGRLMQQLIEKVFVAAFANPVLDQKHDSAVLDIGGARLAFTTDSYVVNPLFFPGGNIGELAVYGTVNDLSMSGARPQVLSCAFIMEEGLDMQLLCKVVASMKEAAARAGVLIVTGDTKVVDKGKGDGLFINTSGIGVVEHKLAIAPSAVRPGDAVIISGDLGRHGIAIMSAREGLKLSSSVESDCAPLNHLVAGVLAAGVEVHCLRDLTRGGLSSALNEIAGAGQAHIQVEEALIPVLPAVQGACELLGLDPLYVANEGRLVAFVPAGQADKALQAMRSTPEGAGARRVGTVLEKGVSRVTLKSRVGVTRILDMLSGEQLPRIC